MNARVVRWCALLLLCLGSARHTPRLPEAGGRTFSLGQPLLWHWQVALGAGGYFEASASDVLVRATAGASRALLNPVTKLAEVGLEAYVGARGGQADGTRVHEEARQLF